MCPMSDPTGLQAEEADQRRVTPAERESTQAAYAWLSRFAPTLDDPATLTPKECRRRLSALPRLREEGEAILDLMAAATGEQARVAETVRDATRQLAGLDETLRRALGEAPAEQLNLDEIRARMAEAEARREVETLAPSMAGTKRLQQRVSEGSLGGAAFMGIFSFGWLSFTTVHAIFMIGGMMHAFGPLALLLLGFYAIFFAAGFGMAWLAVRMGCKEDLDLAGRELSLHRRLLGVRWRQTYQLGNGARARITRASVRQEGGNQTEIAVKDEKGKECRFGTALAPEEQRSLVKRLNEYLEGVCG